MVYLMPAEILNVLRVSQLSKTNVEEEEEEAKNIWKFLMKVKEEAVLSEAKMIQISIGCDLLKKENKRND